jgi:lipid-binding SYLF domain-containing protein
MRTRLLIAAFLISCVSVPALAAKGVTGKDRKVFSNATDVLEALTSAPDSAIPIDLLERAECVLVFPNVIKGAFVVGGRFGRGVAWCKDGAGPAFFSIGGGSVGWQWGGQATDLVLLVMNEDGMKHLLEDNFTLGGKASAAAGPVGRTAEASTDVQLQAQILSWSRSKGLFAGASLEGAVIQPSEDANRRLYGEDVSVDALLDGSHGPHTLPAEASSFVDLATRLTGGSASARMEARED